MDLSKTAKQNRDAVETPLFQLENAIHYLEEIRTRINAALAVWPEVGRTLKPAMAKLDAVMTSLYALQESLSHLWNEGFEKKWK